MAEKQQHSSHSTPSTVYWSQELLDFLQCDTQTFGIKPQQIYISHLLLCVQPVLFAQAGSSVRGLALSSQAATKVSQELGGQGDNVKVRPCSGCQHGAGVWNT